MKFYTHLFYRLSYYSSFTVTGSCAYHCSITRIKGQWFSRMSLDIYPAFSFQVRYLRQQLQKMGVYLRNLAYWWNQRQSTIHKRCPVLAVSWKTRSFHFRNEWFRQWQRISSSLLRHLPAPALVMLASPHIFRKFSTKRNERYSLLVDFSMYWQK